MATLLMAGFTCNSETFAFELHIPGISSSSDENTDGINKDGKCTSECLLEYGIAETASNSLNRPFITLKVDENAHDLIEAEKLPVLTEEDEHIRKLEEFLSGYEPSAGPKLPAPPTPGHKFPLSRALQKDSDVKNGPNTAEGITKGTTTSSLASPKIKMPSVSTYPPVATLHPASTPADAESQVSIKKLRLGEHKDFTRVVLDASGKTNAHIEIDQEDQMIIINLPNTKWEAPDKWYSTTPPLVMAWLAKPDETGKGTRLVIRLKKPVEVSQKLYPPENDYKWHRIILDLRPNT